MKHSDITRDAAPAPPPAARDIFGPRLTVAERYAQWLVGAGIERGIFGPREGERVWERHLLNCAALDRFIPRGARVLDIGSGGGLPGLVLALMEPENNVTLLEPMKRRVEFLTQVTADLQLSNVTVLRGRAEDGSLAQRFDVVTARAVAPLPQLVAWAIPLVAPGGRLLALKGSSAAQELADAGSALEDLGISGRTVHQVEVAGTVTHIVDLPVSSGITRRPQGGRGDQRTRRS